MMCTLNSCRPRSPAEFVERKLEAIFFEVRQVDSVEKAEESCIVPAAF